MANSPLSAEAFLPCLLDRLADDEPEARKESHYRQTLTIAHFRKSVLRDLRDLLNAPSHIEADGWGDFPEVLSSVLNFGTPDLCGKSAASLNPTDLEAQIADSILKFEPRILRRSLSVKMIPAVTKATPNIIGFEIRGLMWANPVPEQFFVQTQLDLETGRCDF